jgi:hypothetical protein
MSNPQVPVNGTLGTNGVFPLVNSPGVVFATDANHTMTYPEMSGSSGFLLVTSGVSLTATRNLVAPLIVGFNWAVENATTGGHSIQVIGATGTGVTIASGYTMTVYCDGTNYVTTPAASGGTVLSVTATAPVASTAGTNPVISMAQATAIVNGWLSSTDWVTFNAKQAALGFTPAHSGANSDISSILGLTTPLSTGQGGSGTAGGTGYRFGNGASPDTYSPTIPSSSISGGVGNQVILATPTDITGITTTATIYLSPYGISSSSITGNNNYLMPLSGTAQALYVGTTVALNSGKTIVVTLQVNRVDTGLTCTLSADSQASDLTHTVSVSAGDTIQFKAVSNGDVSIGQWLTIGFVYGTTPLT